jgi:hypothetical protein
MVSLKLVCINIERSKHLDLVLPFLEREQPDVVSIQELLERDIPRFESIAGPCHAYCVNCLHPGDPPERGPFPEGNGIFSRLIPQTSIAEVYGGSETEIPLQKISSSGDPLNAPRLSLVSACVEEEGSLFTFATTHFTWSPQGEATETQRTDMRALLHELEALGEFVLCGDFNAPRGGEIFDMLASRYKDNIPPEYKTSIDLGLHRAGKARPQEMADKMVDGLFSTPGYTCSNVRLVDGVSDHMAIVATISKS